METLICGRAVPGIGVCTTDSGGPVVIGGELVGIVSLSSLCGIGEYPEIYTNIVAVTDFLLNVTATVIEN